MDLVALRPLMKVRASVCIELDLLAKHLEDCPKPALRPSQGRYAGALTGSIY